jgi:hypothetical protein
MPKWLRLAFLVVLCRTAWATSLVVQLEPNRILIAADSRTSPENAPFTDTTCKIKFWADTAFAPSGYARYEASRKGDPLSAWDAWSAASQAHQSHLGNLSAMATAWSVPALRHFKLMSSLYPGYTNDLIKTGGAVLVDGFFVGFHGAAPLLVVALIEATAGNPPPTSARQLTPPLRDLPYSSNGETQRLLDGQDPTAEKAWKKWKKKAALIEPSERTMRRLEFFIQETTQYDPRVGGPVNILELRPNKAPRWLQNRTCR